MAEELTPGTEGAEGQSDTGTQGTTGLETGGMAEGQSGVADGQGTTDKGTQDTGEETFFNPQDIEDKPELQAAYKDMQRAFGKKMEGIKGSQQKIDAYDAFYQDPLTQIQQMASRMGYQLTRGEAAQVAKEGDVSQSQEPQSWDEVYKTAEDRAYSRIKEELGPMFNQVKEMREGNLERHLDDNFPDWRTYETEMMAKLKTHPSLANDPGGLYRLSVPPEVLESRATQTALKKLQTKAEGSTTSGGSTTKTKSAEVPDKPLTFQESVEFAKKQLASKGIATPT